MKNIIVKKLASLFVASTLLFCLGTSVISSHHAYGTDLKYRRTVDTRLRCTNCGYTSYYKFSNYEYKYECHGYNG